jgi:hypothetical protein
MALSCWHADCVTMRWEWWNPRLLRFFNSWPCFLSMFFWGYSRL